MVSFYSSSTDSTIDDDSLCDDVICATNRECTVVDSNDGMSSRAVCTCIHCDHVTSSSPVCGSDQKTYFSQCHMNREACLSGQSLTVIRPSKCGKIIWLILLENIWYFSLPAYCKFKLVAGIDTQEQTLF